ncbi:hypothetical protein ACLOJK_022247 [Asimina triloba]
MAMAASLVSAFCSTTTTTSNANMVRMRKTPSLPPRLLRPTAKLELKSTQQLERNKGQPPSSMATASDVLHLMDSLQLPVPDDVYDSLLKECTHKRDALQGARVHSHIRRSHSRSRLSTPLANRLLLMYVACGQLRAAHRLFDGMTVRNSISWATLIVGHAEKDDHRQVLQLYLESMQQQAYMGPMQPITCTTLRVLLESCTRGEYFKLGEQVHGWLCKVGRTKDILLGSSLVGLYAKFGRPDSARRVFDQMPRRGSILWASMIAGYCREEHYKEAVEAFKEMGVAGKRKGCFAFSSVLQACGRFEDDGLSGTQVHAQAIKAGVESNSFVQSSLVDMYGKQGLLEEAALAFEMIGERRRDMVIWNAMLVAYTRRGHHKEAIRLLYEMKAAGVEPPESMLNEVRSFL